MMPSINTKKYIETFLKIKSKNSEIIPFKLNYPQQKLYDVIKEQKQKKKPVRIIILIA
jgi:antitoxin component of RelBE/YafQ-DinJ toxin-antitoxin module